MNKKIGHPISHDTIAEGRPMGVEPIAAKKNAEKTRYCKEYGKGIIFLRCSNLFAAFELGTWKCFGIFRGSLILLSSL